MGCGTSHPVKTERSKSQVTIEAHQRKVAAYRRQRIARDMEQETYLRAEAEVEKALMLKRSSVDERRPSYILRALENLEDIEEGQEETEEQIHPVIMVDTCSDIDVKRMNDTPYEHLTNEHEHQSNQPEYLTYKNDRCTNELEKHPNEHEQQSNEAEHLASENDRCTNDNEEHSESHTNKPEEEVCKNNNDTIEPENDYRTKERSTKPEEHSTKPEEHSTKPEEHSTKPEEDINKSYEGKTSDFNRGNNRNEDMTSESESSTRQHEHNFDNSETITEENECCTSKSERQTNNEVKNGTDTQTTIDSRKMEEHNSAHAHDTKEYEITSNETLEQRTYGESSVLKKISTDSSHNKELQEMGRNWKNENRINETLEQNNTTLQNIDNSDSQIAKEENLNTNIYNVPSNNDVIS